MVRWYTILKVLVMILWLQTPRATLTNTTKLCLRCRVAVCSHNCINIHFINVLNGWEWLYVNGAVLGETFTKTSKQHGFVKELVISALYPYPYIYWHRFPFCSMCKSFVIVAVMWPKLMVSKINDVNGRFNTRLSRCHSSTGCDPTERY